MPEQYWNMIMQGGFAGFATALLFIVVWLVNRLLELLKLFQRTMEANARAMVQLTESLDKLRERLADRPCMAERS